jgi:two-component system KDP operon response regulator KdpE
MTGKAVGARILVVDDEDAIARVVSRNLTAHDFAVRIADTGAAALDAYAAERPDLVILDLGLPDMDGTEVVSRIRESASTPIIILSVRGSERDKVRALDLGADDYLTKPFGVEELLARVRVALRHAARPDSGAEPVFTTDGLEVDFASRKVRSSGAEVHLTPTEFDLLRSLIAHPDRVLTDRMLLQEVWGPEYGDEAHYLHVYVARLRKKIEPDPRRPRHILTEPGVGYRFVTDS